MGPEIGTAMRLVSTPMRETSSKLAAIIGVVEIWAARETASRFESDWGRFSKSLSRAFSINDFRGFLSSRMPKTAATESWKPLL